MTALSLHHAVETMIFAATWTTWGTTPGGTGSRRCLQGAMSPESFTLLFAVFRGSMHPAKPAPG